MVKILLGALLAAQLLTAAPAPEPSPPDIPSSSTAESELADLYVADPHSMDGYSQAKFPHWIKQHGKCDTREVVIDRDGSDVVTDSNCRPIKGTWVSPYDGATLTSSGSLNIDHVVPLANAWRSGADAWTTPDRRAFANDLTHPQLVAASAKSVRLKGDQSPDQWMPPLKSFHCEYVRMWIRVKSVYRLSVTQPEKDTLAEILNTC